MNDSYDPTLFEALDPAERDALQQALGEDADASEALALWGALRARLGADLRRDLPDADLLVLYALGEADPGALSPEEEARLIAARPALERAIAAHPALEDVVRRVRADHDAFEAAWEESDLAPTGPDAPTRAEPEVRPKQRAADRTAVRGSTRSSSHRWVWRSAVGVALVAFAALSVFLLQRDAGYETYATAADETRTVALDDGSTVVLAASSRLMVETKDDGARRVRLNGEALFEVIPSDEPFIVETPTALTTVLGTTFGVEASEIETEVVLANGAVEVATRVDPDQSVRLEPGQRSRVVGGQPPEPPTRADVVATLAWTGTWYFHNAPADEVAARFSEHYDVPILLNPSLTSVRVGGAYSADRPVEESVQALAVSLGAEIEGDADAGYRVVPLDR
jgi:ferric-dicitrate binding protein FerR (iron transport regulator)